MTIQLTLGMDTPAIVAPELRRGMRASLPITLGVAPAGLVLGAQAAQKGLSLLELPMMTGLNFAGGSEFAAVGLWTSPPHILLIVSVTFLVNSRHILMGATLAPFIQHLPRRIALPALFLMCDESWVMALTDAKQREADGVRPGFSLTYYLGLSLVLYVSWVVFTTLGAALGPVLGDVRSWGLDMVFPATFLVLLRGLWKGWRASAPWFVSLLAGAVTYCCVPGAWYVVTGALAGLLTAYLSAGDA